ncbi:hypothetical protein HWV62_39097 [Athelia sp. TMB]|nr:hypothetical protein HWV62_39097 [Athelia sp. TMB]
MTTGSSTITYDTLVRAGVKCTSAFVAADDSERTSPIIATGSRGIKFLPDVLFSDINHADGTKSFDVLIIPGGAKGAATISECSGVQTLIKDYLNQDKIVGMICAGSLAALTAKLPSQPLTSHPSVKEQLAKCAHMSSKPGEGLTCGIDFEYSDESVVVSGKLVTRFVLLQWSQ